jgi:hypothetical protein
VRDVPRGIHERTRPRLQNLVANVEGHGSVQHVPGFILAVMDVSGRFRASERERFDDCEPVV